jgi:hypothetical protein
VTPINVAVVVVVEAQYHSDEASNDGELRQIAAEPGGEVVASGLVAVRPITTAVGVGDPPVESS